MYRPWAFWRRVQYLVGLGVVMILLMVVGYVQFLHAPATCFDGKQNGDERGVDCGGACARVCSFDVQSPITQWARAFRVTDGQYNAVAYIENRNLNVGAPKLSYTFTLYDETGETITTRSGTTFLPPDSVYPIFEGRINTGTQVPTRTFIELIPVENWQSADTGREQFEVRSRTLLSADSQPRLNATIYNTSLDDAFNVEIVATIFDARGNALTASQTVVPLFEGRTEQEVVFTWPEPIAKTVRSCEVPSDVVLAIDLSGSMNDDGGVPPEPISSVLAAADSFVGRLQEGDQASLVTYATDARTRETLTDAHVVVRAATRGLTIAPAEETGSTNIGDAIITAVAELQSARHNENARKVLVLLTDGRANAPGENAEAYAIEQAHAAQEAGIEIYTIGLGSTVNEAFLASVAGDTNRRYVAASVANLDRIYRSISTALCEEGAAVIDIVPKTSGVFHHE